MPRGTWQHRIPLLTDDVLCASVHMAEPELSGTGNGSGVMLSLMYNVTQSAGYQQFFR
jgi:hypothetical protein